MMDYVEHKKEFVNTLAGTSYEVEVVEDLSLCKNHMRAKRRKNNFHVAASQERLSKAINAIIYPNTHQYTKAKIFTSSTTKKLYPSRKTELQRAKGKSEIKAYMRGEYDDLVFE